jgi:undecaprenyl-diphosphatase
MALTMESLDGVRLSEMPPENVDDALLDAIWREADLLHRNRLAHRALHPSNILVVDGAPVVVDFAAARGSATPRMEAMDRAELVTSLATIVGSQRAVASASRVIAPEALATTTAYLQPLALAGSTRKQASKSLLQELRTSIADTTGTEPAPLERLVRVRPRTLVMIAALTGAFYVLLPQLANVDDSFTALRSANFAWLALALVFSGLTYVGAAIGLMGGVPQSLPLVSTIYTSLASSFVNRVTPANVGGMALNVRYMQKAGVAPAAAVSGMGLNVLAGGIAHFTLLFVFFFWAGKGNAGFKLPSTSRLLVLIVVLLVVAGVVAATRRGRKLVRTHVWSFVRQSLASIAALGKSPGKLLFLFGGSFGVTLSYISALASSVAAYDTGGVTYAEVGAVYLGSALLAAAAPTPGGLGAMEAALVAGFTGVGMEPGVAVAVVLSYRLLTYWLPILPGWGSFHLLERRNLI